MFCDENLKMNEHKAFALAPCVNFSECSAIHYMHYTNFSNFSKSIDFQKNCFSSSLMALPLRFSVSFRLSLSVFFSLSLSLCLHCVAFDTLSLFSRSIARRGRGDAATPCPSIPLRLATRGSQPWSKYFVISLPDNCNGRTTLQLAWHRRYSLILLIISAAWISRDDRRRLWRFRSRWCFIRVKVAITQHQKLYHFRFLLLRLRFYGLVTFLGFIDGLILNGDVTLARIDGTNINSSPS